MEMQELMSRLSAPRTRKRLEAPAFRRKLRRRLAQPAVREVVNKLSLNTPTQEDA